MSQSATAATGEAGVPNAREHYDITRADLPLHCPMPGTTIWNSHPRVFLPVGETGTAKCPYCGAEYVLVDK